MATHDDTPAFPTTLYYDEEPYGISDGMTLRDYFAAAALPTLIERYDLANAGEGHPSGARSCIGTDHILRNVPALAYKFADAMMKERRKE